MKQCLQLVVNINLVVICGFCVNIRAVKTVGQKTGLQTISCVCGVGGVGGGRVNKHWKKVKRTLKSRNREPVGLQFS